MRILAVDTSAKSASAAVTENGEIKGEFFINTMLTHSETLMPMINAVLSCARVELCDIDGLAVNTGPGSFTGLRIGIAAIKGMAYAKNLPCAAVSTLESMAYNFGGGDFIACAVMDARCAQVYNALFDLSSGKPVRICDDRALSIDELAEELRTIDKTIVLVGDGAKLCYGKFSQSDIADKIVLANENIRYQRASSTAFVAQNIFDNNGAVTPDELMPQYLRMPQAQRELMAKQKNLK